jgi:hypothetical protein
MIDLKAIGRVHQQSVEVDNMSIDLRGSVFGIASMVDCPPMMSDQFDVIIVDHCTKALRYRDNRH